MHRKCNIYHFLCLYITTLCSINKFYLPEKKKKKKSQHCVLCFLIIHIIWMHRQRTFAQMMRTMMTRIMITVMMKSCNHLLMRWTLSFSSWILSKVNRNSFFNLCETQGLFFFSFGHGNLIFPYFLNLAMQASDPLRLQNLTQTLDFHYQALANGVAQHAEQRRVEIEKEKMEKASAGGALWSNFQDMWWLDISFAVPVVCLFHSSSNGFRIPRSSCKFCWSSWLVQWSWRSTSHEGSPGSKFVVE